MTVAADYPGADWIARYRERVNADPEMASRSAAGSPPASRSPSATIAMRLQLDRGRIVDVIPGKRLDVRTYFGLRAPVEVWRKFLSPDPPPLYHDFFAMLMRVPEFVLEGDNLIVMQNARALHRMMNIMRETGHA